jgi:outer membrane protein assembly factor BamB
MGCGASQEVTPGLPGGYFWKDIPEDIPQPRERWIAKCDVSHALTVLTHDGCTVLVKDWYDNSKMHAVDMSTGEVRWTATKASCDVTPLVSPSKGVVLTAKYGNEGVIKALDLTTGELRWASEEPSTFSGAGLYRVFMSFDGETLIVRKKFNFSNSDSLEALDAGTGAVKWTAPACGHFFARFPMNFESDTLLVSADENEDGVIKALDMSTGEARWKAKNVSFKFSPLISSGQKLALVKDWKKNSEMRALDLRTGEVRWTASAVSNGNAVMSFNGEVVLVRDWSKNREMRALNVATGEVRWTASSVSVESDPMISFDQDVVLVRDSNRSTELKALDMATGTVLWSTRIKGNYRPVVCPNGLVLVRHGVWYSENSKLFALDVRTGALRWAAHKVNASSGAARPVVSLSGDIVLVKTWEKGMEMRALDLQDSENERVPKDQGLLSLFMRVTYLEDCDAEFGGSVGDYRASGGAGGGGGDGGGGGG